MQLSGDTQAEGCRKAIIEELMETGLAERCLVYQTKGCKMDYWVEELRQEMWLWLMTYDIDKLRDAWENGHLNALITRYLCNQFNSKTSPFYKTYKKYDGSTDEITDRELSIPDREKTDSALY